MEFHDRRSGEVHDPLGDAEPFSIMAPHRAVQIAGRRWMAAHTEEHTSGSKSAVLPLENGEIARVDWHPKEGFTVATGRGRSASRGATEDSFAHHHYIPHVFRDRPGGERVNEALIETGGYKSTDMSVESNRRYLQRLSEQRGDR